MDSAEHTPGPWALGDENNSHAEVCIGETDTVASLTRISKYTGDVKMSREEMLANAHLIAAAPDLLRVLQELIDDGNVEIYQGAIEHGGGRGFDFEVWEERARAVICEAMGL